MATKPNNKNMSSQCYIMNVDRVVTSNISGFNCEAKPPLAKEKVMSYEEKTVGSTPFFKCEACPFMALAEDDMKFHLFTEHPDLAKTNGLADNIQIPCPGCTSVFDAEETLRTHLRNHHKMGIRDVKKMVKSLVQIALKDAKLKKEDKKPDPAPSPQIRQEIPDVKIPQVIEIVPDVVNANGEPLPKGVAFISVDELNKMSTPNFEKVDPKEIIQEASINIVYTNEVTGRYVNVSNVSTIPTTSTCSMIQVSSVAPDLISSIQPHVAAAIDKTNLSPPQPVETSTADCKLHNPPPPQRGRPMGSISGSYKSQNHNEESQESKGEFCGIDNCHFRLKSEEKLTYHRKCHQNGMLKCPECLKPCTNIEGLNTHLWKEHAVDIELPTCEICGYKTFKKYRLYNIHMKCHGKIRAYSCPICSKCFKTRNQMEKHKLIHKKDVQAQCSVCSLVFNSERRLKDHFAAVHEKQKRFKCTECEHTSARKSEMVLHMRSHTGDKPYACDKCPYRSADNSAMRRHKRSHAKEGVYRCKLCLYTTIQSTSFSSHMITKHPNINSDDIHCCPYCRFKTVNKQKYVIHLSTHSDKEEIKLLNRITNSVKNENTWTIPNDNTEKCSNKEVTEEQSKETKSKDDTSIDVEVYDCDDSISESLPQDYSKNYTAVTSNTTDTDYNNQVIVQDLSKEDNNDNSDCLISESSNDTLMDRHQFAPQLPLQMIFENPQQNLHGFLNTSVSLEQNLMQNSSVNSLVTSHSPIDSNISNNIMCNFPIRLPPPPSITLKPVDKISIPLTTKVTGPIIKPTQILPVPSSSNSPVNISMNEPEGVPRKKPKISVKSNLILKGPDQENMFHSQQKMAFKQLEDSERYGLGGPVTFNNLITTQFMQLPPEPAMSESPSNIMVYPQKDMGDSAATPVDSEIPENSQIFTFNQQMNVSQMTLLPPPQKIQTNDPSYIKIEAQIKQNTQSPSLERMCNANLLNNQSISREYKASPPLEDIHKNMSEIKNEVKSDTFYNIRLSNNATNPSMIDQYLIDNIMGEQYNNGHLELSGVVMSEVSDDQQNDVIEIDDNSDDTKLLPRFDMNFPLESLYLMHNDFHFLDNEVPANNIPNEVNEMNRMVAEVPMMNQKENVEVPEVANNDFSNFIQGKKDPMMNTSVRPSSNKINVKNIELMKN